MPSKWDKKKQLDHFERSRQCEAACFRRHLYPALAKASIDKPQTFSEEVLSILKYHLPIIGASLYSYNTNKSQLILRGQVGLDYKAYSSFELPLDTYAGEVVRTKQPNAIKVLDSSKFRDKSLIRNFGLNSMLAIPLRLDGYCPESFPDPLGVLCVYPEAKEDLDHLQSCVSETVPFVTRLYLSSLDNMKSLIRSAFVRNATYSHDIGSLIHRALALFANLFSVEGASMFLTDEYTNILRLHGSTGLPNNYRRMDVFYTHDSTDPICRVMQTGNLEMHNSINDDFDKDVVWEKTVSEKKNCLLLPIIEASVPPESKREVFGVLRATNKYLSHDGISNIISFCWEDIYLQNFFGELVAVAIHYLKKSTVGAYDYARMMHGARNNLGAVIRNLKFIDQHDLMKPDIHPEYKYYLLDSIDYIEDLRSQVKRLGQKDDELKKGKVQLYGGVLSKLPGMIKRIARSENLGNFKVTNLVNAKFEELPPVIGNRNALLTVFRNLIENSIKYCNRDEPHKYIDFNWQVVRDKVEITVSDNGIGIPRESANRIFVEGFRAINARRRVPVGRGFGLSDSKDLMIRMEGDLKYVPENNKTTFKVAIPLWSKRRKDDLYH